MSAPTIRFADAADLDWCVANDGWLDKSALRQKIEARELVVADVDGELAGLLRLDFLWSTLPHIAQIRVVEEHRREGIGRALVAFVAGEARRSGADKLLSSTRLDKTEAQEWHRRVGFRECGSLSGFGPNGEPTIFFLKAL
jgi:ribosomal protein S18 acetylase RimI-like enzyme